jgi:hypothetical protein
MSKNIKSELSEALKRHNLLLEYDFYIPRKEENNMYKGVEDTIDEQDETTPTEDVPSIDDVMGDMDVTTDVEEPTDMSTLPTTEPTTPQTTTPTDTTGGEVEVDVTDIVKDTKETKEAVNTGNQKVDELMNKLSDLENKLASMNDLVSKIDELETQFEKRNPTPEEKLEMRSLDSFPYNLKLTDYWSEKEGAYAVMNNDNKEIVAIGKEPVEKEYVLTQDEVDQDYNEGEVSDSFYPENQ